MLSLAVIAGVGRGGLSAALGASETQSIDGWHQEGMRVYASMTGVIN